MNNYPVARRWLWPVPHIALLAVVLLATFSTAAKASQSSLQRRDYAYNTYFELDEDGLPAGTVIRERWRQPFRSTYDLYDAQGDAVASATTRLLSLGLIFPWARTLDIKHTQSRARYQLTGVLFTLETAIFRLYDADRTHLADLRMDLRQSGVVATYPHQPRKVFARFYRNQVSDFNYERWDYAAVDNSHVPSYIWPLLASFFADVW